MDFEKVLLGGDLRSIGKSNSLVSAIQSQRDFDNLFDLLFHEERIIVMRAADVIEKVTEHHPEFLAKHKTRVFELISKAENKELKWHLALIVPRLLLDQNELDNAWEILKSWAKDKTNSRIVRVNSMQGLFMLIKGDSGRQVDFVRTLDKLQKENIPSLSARIKKLRNAE